MSETKTVAEAIGIDVSKIKFATPEQIAASQEAGRAAKVGNLRTLWNAPRRHVECSANPEGEWGKKLAMLKSKLGGGMLVALVGIRGNGKTQLAVELMRESTAQLRSALFTTAIGFFGAVKRAYRSDSHATEQEEMRPYKKNKLLVIDEVGKRGETEWENNQLFELINSRYNDMLDTVLIDNREEREFVEMIGPSLASRMHECGGIIECTWKSFRE